jgi:glycosyltransferase involved in cell wall biosynthesis
MRVAIIHDHLVQRGGSERVALTMANAFGGAPIYTSFFDAGLTYPEFAAMDVHCFPLNRIRKLRSRHRSVAPLLAPWFGRLRVEADAVICSSAGWSHTVPFRGPKIVYFHSPARWLYDTGAFLKTARRRERLAAAVLRPLLLGWDQRRTQSATFLANSSVVRDRVREAYGVDAAVLPPGSRLLRATAQRPVPGLEPGFSLCVSRLLAYKNVHSVVAAFRLLPEHRLVVVGVGPRELELRESAPPNVQLVGAVDDDQLRWLYNNCGALVAASYEDFGLTPIEAAHFGKPSAVLRWGGYLDTAVEGETGFFFDAPEPADIADALRRVYASSWSEERLVQHAERFSEERFTERLRAVVDRALAVSGASDEHDESSVIDLRDDAVRPVGTEAARE